MGSHISNYKLSDAKLSETYFCDVIPPPGHLQCCDLGFHASLARTMRTFLSAEYSLETSRHEGLDLLEGAVDAMDVRGDKLKVMDMHSQIFCPPARFGYQPHMGDEVGVP